MKGLTWILHHSGDANVPPIRVAHTQALARTYPNAAVIVPQAGVEADTLEAWDYSRVFPKPRGRMRDTLDEALAVRALTARGDAVIVSTEDGHLRRAALIHRILFAFTGVAVRVPAAPRGTYQDRWWRLWRDGARAVVAAVREVFA